MANIPLQSISFPGLSDKYTTPVVDNTLTQTGAAADAKKTGDEIGAIKNDLSEKADKSEALSAYIVETETGSIASFSDGADDVPVKDLTVAIEPVQSGSGDPSPSNVRPISGWTGANVTRTGKNLLDFTEITSTYPGELPIIKQFNIPQDVTFQFTASSDYANSDNYWLVYAARQDNTKTYITPTAGQTVSRTITGTSENPITEVYIRNAGITAGKVYNLQLELGSTTSTYEPYQGETYEVDWTTEAGTVYGGTLDVTTGVLTVDRAMMDLGTLTWTYSSGAFISQAISQMKNNPYTSNNLFCTIYPIKPVPASDVGYGIRYAGYESRLLAVDNHYSDVPTFMSAMNGVMLVYELATPQTYQLTPQEVQTILGQNNIFADCGNVTVQYRADTKLYIDKVLSQA